MCVFLQTWCARNESSNCTICGRNGVFPFISSRLFYLNHCFVRFNIQFLFPFVSLPVSRSLLSCLRHLYRNRSFCLTVLLVRIPCRFCSLVDDVIYVGHVDFPLRWSSRWIHISAKNMHLSSRSHHETGAERNDWENERATDRQTCTHEWKIHKSMNVL